MTKEEEEAIDRLRKITNRQILYGNKYGIVIEEFKKLQEDIETVLNMLKEKDEEIEKLKKENEHWKNGFERELEDNRENACKLLKQDLIIRKKDRQIDLMAEHIVSSAIVDDTVCAIKCDCETDIEEDCTHEKMLICTKQYFERKVE